MSTKTFCRDHRKTLYSSWDLADKVRARANRRNGCDLDDGSVYWCVEAGGWHMTSWKRPDVDRIAALRLNPQAVDKPVDGGGREIDLRDPVDMFGAAARNSTDLGLGILLAGRANRDPAARRKNCGGPSHDREDRQ